MRLTYRWYVSIVVTFVTITVHDTSFPNVRVTQHQNLVSGCEIQRHVCFRSFWTVVGLTRESSAGGCSLDTLGVEDRFEACAFLHATKAALTIATFHRSCATTFDAKEKKKKEIKKKYAMKKYISIVYCTKYCMFICTWDLIFFFEKICFYTIFDCIFV